MPTMLLGKESRKKSNSFTLFISLSSFCVSSLSPSVYLSLSHGVYASRLLCAFVSFQGSISTMLNDEVCTLYCFDAKVQCSAIICAFIFSVILERFSMTNNDNATDNSINLHHGGNNDLHTICISALHRARFSLPLPLHLALEYNTMPTVKS